MEAATTESVAAAATATVTAGTEIARGDDGAFGPQLGSRFDFTLVFDHAILTIAPTVALIAACPLYVYFRHRDPVQVNRDALFWAKLSGALVLFLIQLAQLALWTTSVKVASEQDWAIGASAVSCFAALCIALMLSTAHRRSIRPSALLSVYFFITVFLDGIRARSYLLREGLDAIGAIQVVVTIAKFALLILEEIPKTASLIDADLLKFFGKEAFSGFWARSLLIWLNETFIIGFRHILTVDDLGNLGPEFSTQHLVSVFNNIWARVDKTNEHALHIALFKQHYGSLLLAAPARIGLSVCSFAQPFIIYHAVDIVDRADATDADKNGLVLATALVYAGIPLFRAIYTYYTNRCAILVRGTLLGKIYGKTLVLPAQQAADGTAFTHVTADIDGIAGGILEFHDLWISYFEIGFSTYFLYLYMQYSCFLLFISTGASTAWSWYFGPKIGNARKIWTEKIDKRVKETASLLAQARAVKTLGLTDTVKTYIYRLRETELKFSGRFRWSQSIVHCMGMMLESVTPVIVVAGVIYLSKSPLPLEARRMFTILAFVTLSAIPMQMILRSYSGIRETTSCVDRIAIYLAKSERHDGRSIKEVAHGPLQEKGTSAQEPRDYKIEVVEAFVAPNGEEETVVHNATVSVPHGQLTVAVGPTGSGKSIFLKSLLGEADIVDGRIIVDQGPIAYCHQKPWICNETIRANITGRGEVDETWYRSVLSCCCLLEDLEDLPDGDETLAGSNGSKLSGGQKLRVALARALNSRAQIMIFDDIFSGLDQVTARKIFYGLFSSDGLLRRLRTTVILATHSMEFIDAADSVLQFDSDGKIVVEAGRGDQELEGINHTSEAASVRSEDASNNAAKEVNATPEEPEEDEEAANLHHRGDWSLWLFFFKSAPTWMFVAFVTASLVDAVAERMASIFMRIWIDTRPNSRSLFAAYAALGFASTITYLAMAILLYQTILPRYAKYFHKMLVDTILGANIVFLTSTDHALLVNRITQDMTVITQAFAGTLLQFPYSIGTVLTDLGLVMSASYYALILIPFLCVMFYAIQLVFLRTSRQLRILDLEATTPLHKQLTEMGSGIEHIRSFQWEERYLRQSYELIDASQKPRYYMNSIQRWLTLVLELTNLVLAVVMVVFAIFWDHATTKSSIGLGFIGLLSLGEALQFFVTTWTTMETSMGAIARLRAFKEETPQEFDDANPLPVPANWPQHGVIEFKNVTATYNPEKGAESVLRNVSFRIPAHKTAGFIGRTGSGKSTIFLVLLGFLPYDGSVTIDGLEVSRVPRNVLRSRITAIPQDGLILPGTIRQNLMPWLLNEKDPRRANQCSMLAITQVLEDTMLTEKIIAAGNLDAPVEKLGMSAGERQLFSVARSMFLNLWYEARVVLMDEASSSVDQDTDSRLQWAIGEAFHGLTICSITHRLNTVLRAHIVFELDKGVISVNREEEEPEFVNAGDMINYPHPW